MGVGVSCERGTPVLPSCRVGLPIFYENEIFLKNGNEVFYKNALILQVKDMLCSKLHRRKGVNLILFSCKIHPQGLDPA
jgi:hypothetical protein